MNRPLMNRHRQIRIVGLLALLALGFHAGELLGHDHHDAWSEAECTVCYLHQSTVSDVAAPVPLDTYRRASVDTVAEVAPPAARQAPSVCHLSRGPPA